MAVDQIERPHFYQRQYVGAIDMTALVEYARDLRRRHNIGPHTWGIVVGLNLLEVPREDDPTAVDVFVSPGMATDGFGREIVNFSPYRVDPALFEAFIDQAHRSVWIQHDELEGGEPKYGWGVCHKDQYGRVFEGFRLVVDPGKTTHDSITVDGKAAKAADIPAGESVPFQEFPADSTDPLWLVRLGSVNWDGVARVFRPAAPGRLEEGRRYIRIVAEQVMAPAATLLLRGRNNSSPLPTDNTKPDYNGVAVEVEGSLQVDRLLAAKQDIQLHGGRLLFLDPKGLDNGIPLWMQRLDGPSPGTADLRIHIGDGKIGDPAAAAARLTVGDLDASGKAESVVLDVRGDDLVEIPTGALDFRSQTRQMIHLWTSSMGERQYGIGVQANTTYFRSHSDFAWFQGGVHSDVQSDPGGGVLQLRLNNEGLFFGARTRQMLNLWNTGYGVGVQDSTLYFRSDFDYCWFRLGSHSDLASDPGGGALLMKLDRNSKLSVSGDLATSGNLRVAGNQDLIRVMTFPLMVQNGGADTPGTWDVNYAGQLSQLYMAFVALQGFNIFGTVGITPTSHNADVGMIPQHVFVRINVQDLNHTSGVAYCSQSDVSVEFNNVVQFTLVVIGKGVM